MRKVFHGKFGPRLTVTIILLLAAVVRFWDLPGMVYFEYDDQYNSYLVYDLIKNHHLSLVGQQMSFGGMFLGPWHYLFLVPFYMLTDLHPLGGYVGEAVIGLLIIFSYYWTGKRMFSTKTGLLAAFLRAIVFSLIMQDHNIGPAYPSELIGIWFIYFLYRLHRGKTWAFIPLAFLAGMMFTVHPVILPLVLVAAVSLARLRPFRWNTRITIFSLAAFLVPIAPQLVFEIRHNFAHVLSLTRVVMGEGRVAGDGWAHRLLYILSYNLGNFYRLLDNVFLPWWLGFFVFGAIVWMIIKKRGAFTKLFHRWFFPLATGVVGVYYLVYPRHVPEYYFMVFTILTVFYVSALLEEISSRGWGKVAAVLALLICAASNGWLFYKAYTNPAKFSLAQKDAAVKAIVDHQRGKGDFSVSYFTEYGRRYGFQYFFTYYGLEPRNEIKPPIYSLVLPRGQVADKDLSASFGDIGVIFPEKEPQQSK